MNTVVIDGVTYTKASILAKQFHYTTDYIGQLCRGGKVDAQLVGRSWYVSLDSLESHASKRVEALRQDEITLQNKSFIDTVKPLAVLAPLSKITKKVLHDSGKSINLLDNYVATRYEPDPVDLVPQVRVRPILPTITVQTDSHNSAIKPVNDVTAASLTPENVSFPISINLPKVVKISPVLEESSTKLAETTKDLQKNVLKQAIIKQSTNVKQANSVPANNKTPVSFTPTSIVVPVPARKIPYKTLAFTVLLLGLGTILSAVMLDVEVYYAQGQSSTSFSINQTALIGFFKD